MRAPFVLALAFVLAFGREASAAETPVLVATTQPKADYVAAVSSGVPLDGAYAKERGVSKGLVYMVFEKERRKAFRVPRARIKKLARFAADLPPGVMLVKTAAVPHLAVRIDVLETDERVIVVETVSGNAGIFTGSDVYVFPKGATLEQRLAAISGVPPLPRARLRTALERAAAARP